MKIAINVAPWFAAAAVGGAVVLAAVASAAPCSQTVPHSVPSLAAAQYGTGPDPTVPFGATPYVPLYPSPGDPFSTNPNLLEGNAPSIEEAF
jgi:hypothetical protein